MNATFEQKETLLSMTELIYSLAVKSGMMSRAKADISKMAMIKSDIIRKSNNNEPIDFAKTENKIGMILNKYILDDRSKIKLLSL